MQSTRLVSQRPRWGDFLATNRGGGLYSELVSQRIGATIALVASRLRLVPTALTLVNLGLGLGASVAVVVLAPGTVNAAADETGVRAWQLGLVALLAWQLAYAFDCADGQLARVTGRTSPAGARLDVLCDVAAQIALVAALSAVAVAHRPGTPAWLVATFAGTWMVNLVTSVMASGPHAGSLMPSRSGVVRTVKLIRDYGAVILVAGVVLAIVPQWTIGLLWAFVVVNGGFLLASIAHSSLSSLRS